MFYIIIFFVSFGYNTQGKEFIILEGKNMYKILGLVTLTALTFTGCTSPMASITPSTNTQRTHTQSTHIQSTYTQSYEKPTPEKLAMYQQTMRNVAAGIKNDTNYQRIALDTPAKKEWFKSLTYRLWDRQITRQQFIAEGLSKYPTHQYEFNFVVNGFFSTSS